ncbi:MAG: hypothetical protein ACK5AZ_27105 [Bryobacteraceae bacterium]
MAAAIVLVLGGTHSYGQMAGVERLKEMIDPRTFLTVILALLGGFSLVSTVVYSSAKQAIQDVVNRPSESTEAKDTKI